MCRKAKCAYLRDGYCILHKADCSRALMRDTCPDGVTRLGLHEHRCEQSYLRALRTGVRGEGCLNPNAKRPAGRDVYKTCTSKRRFRSYERGREVVTLAARREGLQLAVYECPFCHGYHLTRQLRPHLEWTVGATARDDDAASEGVCAVSA